MARRAGTIDGKIRNEYRRNRAILSVAEVIVAGQGGGREGGHRTSASPRMRFEFGFARIVTMEKRKSRARPLTLRPLLGRHHRVPMYGLVGEGWWRDFDLIGGYGRFG